MNESKSQLKRRAIQTPGSFKGIRPGDRIRFFTSRSLGHQATAMVNPLLIFPTHVVVNHGNNGTVVSDTNFLHIVKRDA